MSKRKLTLSIREDLLTEIKRLAALEGKSISSIVEEYFEDLILEKWIESLSEELGLGDLEPTSESEIPKNRPRGLDSTKIIRELREKRGEARL
jgi:hypothetical protein